MFFLHTMCHELKSEQEQECPTPPVDFYRHSEQDNGHVGRKQRGLNDYRSDGIPEL